MDDKNGPTVFATIYTAAVLLTILLAMTYARHGEEVAKIGLGVLQITVTVGAIFSAWALQQQKRKMDQADAAESTADAVVAVALSIDKIYSFVEERAADGRTSRRLFVGNSATLKDELTALASVPLTALKPAKAAVALVEYRRFARQAAIVMDRCAEDIRAGEKTDRISKRHSDLRRAERALLEALGRPLPIRLDRDEYARSTVH